MNCPQACRLLPSTSFLLEERQGKRHTLRHPVGSEDPHSGPHAFTVSASPTGPSSQPPTFYANRDFIQFFQNDNGVTWSLCPQLLCRLITHKEKISLKQNLWGFDRVARSAHLFHSEDCTFKELPGLEIKPPLYVCFPVSSHCLQMFVMTESRSFVFESLFLQNASWGQQQ